MILKNRFQYSIIQILTTDIHFVNGTMVNHRL
jgi:hypothetical protein